jgi:DNA-binding MarR family transcriptional regulator
VADLAAMSGLSKQSASRTLSDLEVAGLIVKAAADADGRRRSILLTQAGLEFEARVSERLRQLLARAYRSGGLDGVAGARRILAALAGSRLTAGTRREGLAS